MKQCNYRVKKWEYEFIPQSIFEFIERVQHNRASNRTHVHANNCTYVSLSHDFFLTILIRYSNHDLEQWTQSIAHFKYVKYILSIRDQFT